MGLALTALALAHPPAAWSKTFEDNFGRRFQLTPLGSALAESIGSTLPVISASPGIVYRFNIEMGVPQRETEIGGQLFLERPETVGEHRWNLSLNYQRVKLETLNGDDIGQLRDLIPIRMGRTKFTFTIPRFGIDLDTHEFTGSATFGVTDDLDLNITIPVLYSDFGLVEKFQLSGNPKPIGFAVRSNALGVGDVFLRGKYRFLDADWTRLALGALLRVPSGNEQNFQGTGAVELAPMLYASSRPIHVSRLIYLEPYLNAGFNVNADDIDRSEPRWGVGLDCGITERLTAAVAVLGRHPLRSVGRPGLLDVRRLDRATGRTFLAPLLGIRDRRPDFYDVSIGGRVNFWRDTLVGFVNAIVPLNADGFRAEVIPLAGVEASF